VSFDPAGRRIASGSDDKTVRVWDAQSGAELACLCGHEDFVRSVSFDPAGRRIASGSDDKTVRVWDAQSGAELACLRGHGTWVTTVAWDRAGRRIASGARDRTVRVWEAQSGAELARLRGHEGAVTTVAWDRAGRRIASGAEDKTVRVWDAQSGACLEVIDGQGDVQAIADGAEVFPFRAIHRSQETVIEPAEGGEALAWFPAALDHVATHPSGLLWTGSFSLHLYLIRLKGDVGGGKREDRSRSED
jgi:WD40 repeat protein